MSIEHTTFVDESKLVSLDPSTIKWQQLQPGKLDIAYKVLPAPPVVISLRSVNLSFHGHAQMVKGRAGIVTVDSGPEARWRGSAFGAASIAIGHEIDVRTAGPSTILGLAFDRNQAESLFPDSLDASDVLDTIERNRISVNPVAAHRVSSAIRSVCSSEAPVTRGTAETLIALAASTLKDIDNHSVQRSHCLNRRYAAVRTCERHMREHIDDTITLLDLSRACGMRSRSLINAFEAITGLSPMDYLKRLRLSAVRSNLLRADARSTRVIDVATAWGFWHMGHFAHDYRVMFGEPPSQTLLSR
ncbi:MAG TPA: helix-turn-helix domain-containing protein [Candidatus Tumulicola sp.]|jgi:AraC-like DNA-binding protein